MFFKKNEFFFITIILLLILFVFRSWFSTGTIASGDLGVYFPSMYKNFSLFPQAWFFNHGSGLGGFVAPFLWVYMDFSIPINLFGSLLNFKWEIIQRIFLLFPFLILSFLSPIYLYKTIFPGNKFYFLAPLVFVLNTYILMLIDGGQILIGVSYALFPFSLGFFIRILEKYKSDQRIALNVVLLGILLSVQLMLDIRVGYILGFSFFLYFLLLIISDSAYLAKLRQKKNFAEFFLKIILIPLVSILMLHSFWLIPTLFASRNPLAELGPEYTSSNAVKFFSFANLENTISLLHPNWPENIFGKSYFMKFQFLIIPLLAYLSLFFFEKKYKRPNKTVLFFVLLSLFGAFLAKGVNEPFGNIYNWLFSNVPGFGMFRDPTKWYVLICLSYSLLLPFSISRIYEAIVHFFEKFQKEEYSRYQYAVISSIFIIGWVLLIFPAFSGKLDGTLKAKTIPSDYLSLESYLSSQNRFYRTLWIPQVHRYAYFSPENPAIAASTLFKEQSITDIEKMFRDEKVRDLLESASVKYVIVPIDTEGEIFVDDHKFSKEKYMSVIEEIEGISWLNRVDGFESLHVFETEKYSDHIMLDSKEGSIRFETKSPTKYLIDLKNVKSGDRIIFSEQFDKAWKIKQSSEYLTPQLFDGKFNSYVLSRSGDYSVFLSYHNQKYVNAGTIISIISFFAYLCIVVKLLFKK